MNWTIGTLLMLFAVAGGVLGWWKGTRDLTSPPDRLDRPIGTGRRDFERGLYKRYRRRRILLTAGGTLGGAVGGFAALLLFASTRRGPR